MMQFSLLVQVQCLFLFLWLYQVLVLTNFYLCADIKNFETEKEKFVYVVEDGIDYNKQRREKTYSK